MKWFGCHQLDRMLLDTIVHMICIMISNHMFLCKIRSHVTLHILGYNYFTLAPIMDDMACICQIPMYSPGLTMLIVSS